MDVGLHRPARRRDTGTDYRVHIPLRRRSRELVSARRHRRTYILHIHQYRHVCGHLSIPRKNCGPGDRRHLHDSACYVCPPNPVLPNPTNRESTSVSNLGGTFPRIFVLKLVDAFTTATCIPPEKPIAAFPTPFEPFSCALEQEKHRCKDQGGVCHIQRDGYYITNVLCILIGVVTFWAYIKPVATRLSALPMKAWREYDRS
jgi:hypothetical protein